MKFIENVLKVLSGSADRVIILDESDPIQFEKLKGAVVVLHAEWSGPSVKVIREYVKAFQRVFESFAFPVEFYVLNFDKLSTQYLQRLPGPLGGNGETFFIKNGSIARTISNYTEVFESEFLNCFSKQ